MSLADMKALCVWAVGNLVMLYVIGVVLAAAINATPIGRDDSDSQRWGSGRSGLKIYHDALSGCEYVGTPGGGLTPRLNSAGQPVCRPRA